MRLFFTIICLFLPFYAFSKPPELTPRATRIKIEEILRAHATHHTLTQELVKRTLENYLHELDPTFSYFIEPEIIKWKDPTPELTSKVIEAYKKDDFSTFHDIYDARRGIVTGECVVEVYVRTPFKPLSRTCN